MRGPAPSCIQYAEPIALSSLAARAASGSADHSALEFAASAAGDRQNSGRVAAGHTKASRNRRRRDGEVGRAQGA
jgi:hypothetical protein